MKNYFPTIILFATSMVWAATETRPHLDREDEQFPSYVYEGSLKQESPINLTKHTSLVVGLDQPIKVTENLDSWNDQFAASKRRSNRTKSHVICFETTELKGAFLCAFEDAESMNLALARASHFVEGGSSEYAQARENISSFDPYFFKLVNIVGGHDLRAKHLIAYYSAAQKKCMVSSEYCLNPFEKTFFEQFVLPTATQNPDFVLITYALRSQMSVNEVVTHEILHAQYFLLPEFKSIADSFWESQVDSFDKSGVKEVLKDTYNVNDEELVSNEFQAYILMTDAHSNFLSGYVEKYRGPLMDALAAKGLSPLHFKN